MSVIQDLLTAVGLECDRLEGIRGETVHTQSLAAYLLDLEHLIRRAAADIYRHRDEDLLACLFEVAALAIACLTSHGAPARRRGVGEEEWLGELTGLDLYLALALVEEECEHIAATRAEGPVDLPGVVLELEALTGDAARLLGTSTAPGGAEAQQQARRALRALGAIRCAAGLAVHALAAHRVSQWRAPA